MTWEEDHLWTTSRVDNLPLVLAGPLLRRATATDVTVWLALRGECNVELQLFDAQGTFLVSKTELSFRVGERLHLVCITILPQPGLTWGALYQYDLVFSPTLGTPNPPASGATLLSTGVLSHSQVLAQELVSYASTVPNAPLRPCFALAPTSLSNLRIFHGSCRKMHGESRDALAALDDAIAETLLQPSGRPHALCLTGDQIYADDVEAETFLLCNTLAEVLLGWDEDFPFPGAPPGNTTKISFLGLESRKSLLYQMEALGTPENHLFGLGEYCAMYLLAWSEVLWPSVRRDPSSGGGRGLARFVEALPRARRALANTPTYMIFDDHDVSDDWNLTPAWCEWFYGSLSGRRIAMNALTTYWLFQGWGNDYERMNPARRTTFGNWFDEQSELHNNALQADLSMPTVGEPADLVGGHTASSLSYNFRIQLPQCDLVALDQRTWRQFSVTSTDEHRPAALLPPDALTYQIPTKAPTALVTVLLSPCAVFGLPLTVVRRIGMLVYDYLRAGAEFGYLAPDLFRYLAAYGPDRGDKFGAQSQDMQRFFSWIAKECVDPANGKGRVVILTGDIHCAFTSRIQYWATRRYEESLPGSSRGFIAANLISSALHNEDWIKRRLHNLGFETLFDALPETQKWAGWNDAPTGLDVDLETYLDVWLRYYRNRPDRRSDTPPMMATPSVASTPVQPDWRYRLDFLLGQPDNRPQSSLPPPGTAWLEQWRRQGAEYYNYVKAYGDGSEITGRNNLGEVSFELENGEPVELVHTLWWRLNDSVGLGPATRYSVSLRYDDAAYPMPEVPAE